MEGWLILSKFFIVVYVAGVSISINTYNLSMIVLSLLLYLSLNISMYIMKDTKNIKIISLMSMVVLIGVCKWFSSVLILLMPINLFEFMNLNNIKKEKGISLAVIPLFFLKNTILKEYLLIATLSYVIYSICYTFKMKFTKLIGENDFLKENNYLLKKNITKDTEYENQIMYMSQLEERNKIAQEIHDNIGHTISGSLMQLEAAKFVMEKDINKGREMIQNTIEVLRYGMESIRATLRNIKPPSEQIGISKLKLILNQYEVSSKIKASLYYDGELKEISNIHQKAQLKII